MRIMPFTRVSGMLLLLLAACSTNPGDPGQGSLIGAVPARFQRLSGLLRTGRPLAAAGNAQALAGLRGGLTDEGLALLRARIPNDLRRQDMPRFLAARREFGEALTRLVAAIEARDDPGTLAAFRALDDATQGWIDAYAGRATETAV